MKISIVGSSGSGKTYLARKLSEKEWKKNLDRLLKKDSWIIEGVNPLVEVLEKADKIIYLRPSMLNALLSQWKRYFTDQRQRKEYGFLNNVKLTKYILRQFLQEPDPKEYKNPKYSRVRKVDRMVNKYAGKLIKFTSKKKASQFIQNSCARKWRMDTRSRSV